MKKSFWKRLKSFLITLLIALVISETILQFIKESPEYYIWPPHFSATLNVEDGTMPGISNNSEFSINSEGVRGVIRTGNETTSILAIGGSTTECFYLDDSEAWPYLIQEELSKSEESNVWVGNIGRSGLNAFHHVLTLEKGIEHYGKVDIVLFLIGVNDVNRDINRALGISLDQRSMLDQTFMQQPSDTTRGIIQHLEIARLINNAFTPKPAETFPKHLVQDACGSAYNNWRNNRENALHVIEEVPNLAIQQKEYSENINKLIDLCKAQYVQPVFMLQPSMYAQNIPDSLKKLLWMGGIGDFQGSKNTDYYSPFVMESLLAQYNSIVSDICSKRRIEVIDLPSQLAKNTSIFYDDCHFNENGSKQVANAVIEHLTNRK